MTAGGLGCWTGILIGAAAAATAAQAALPAQPVPLAVRQDPPGAPPAFLYPQLPAGADQIQFEVWFAPPQEIERVYVRSWIDASTAYLNPVTFDGEPATEVFLRGSSSTGFMMFREQGTYRVRWRGYNAQGYGPWSDFSAFRRIYDSQTLTLITRAPNRVTSNGDVAFSWTNDVADEVYSAQFLSGGRAVRNAFGRGAFQAGWIYQGEFSYQDRPSSPSGELPNGSYTFRVRAWSPAARIWSPWATHPFEIARRMPRRPSLATSQQDFNGFFNRSPRPRFLARYGSGRTPALWTRFDIRRLSGSRQTRIALQWVSRYTSAASGAGIGNRPDEIGLRGEYSFPDLPPGTYVWRAQASNGSALSRWTPFRTNRFYAAGALARPPTTGMSFHNGTTWYEGRWEGEQDNLSWTSGQWRREGKIAWRTIPNAFAYNIQILRNNEPYLRYANLDPRTNACTLSRSGRSLLFIHDPFPPGNYQFRVQAVNQANPPAQRRSPWSLFSPRWVIP